MTTSINEWTHFFIKIYLSHFIRKGWCWLCVRSELEMETDCYILTQSSSDHSSTSFSFWLLNCGSLGPQALSLQADSQAGILSPNWLQLQLNWNWLKLTDRNSNWLKLSVAPGYIIVWCPPASCGHTHLHQILPHPQVKVIFRYLRPDEPVSPPFRLFTQVHLLIDGSVKGQYATFVYIVSVIKPMLNVG